MRPLRLPTLSFLFLFFQLLAPNLFGQSYDENWDSRFNLPGALGRAHAATFDEKGNLYVMGARTINGIRLDNSISRWNGTEWLHLMEIGEALTVAGRQMQFYPSSFSEIVVRSGRIYMPAELLGPSTFSCVLVWNGSE